MDVNMKGITQTIKCKEKVHLRIRMERNLLVYGKTIKKMEKDNT